MSLKSFACTLLLLQLLATATCAQESLYAGSTISSVKTPPATISWINENGSPLLDTLYRYLLQVDSLGLTPGDYNIPYVQSLCDGRQQLPDENDTAFANRELTCIATQFFHDLAYGRPGTQPVSFNGTGYSPTPPLPAEMRLYDAVAGGYFGQLQAAMEPQHTIYRALKRSLQYYRDMITDTLRAPLAIRIHGIQQSMDQVRWASRMLDERPVIIVNIPSADLQFYRNDSLLLYTRVILGRPTLPTHTLCSTITSAELYPYWQVPRQIAVQELLPEQRRDPHYLEDHQFQLLSSTGKVLNPRHIAWQQVNKQHFPYHLRQSTGCDNALGIIKFKFNSPYDIYLHDTPGKTLFQYDRRFFSHGCIRVEEALALARILLEDKPDVAKALLSNECLKHQAPEEIALAQPVWILVLYNTAWPDAFGKVRFYPDVYNLQHFNN